MPHGTLGWSRLFTGIKDADLRRDFDIPPEVKPMAVLGFGYPVREIRGKKSRKPLEELVYSERFGTRFHPTE